MQSFPSPASGIGISCSGFNLLLQDLRFPVECKGSENKNGKFEISIRDFRVQDLSLRVQNLRCELVSWIRDLAWEFQIANS